MSAQSMQERISEAEALAKELGVALFGGNGGVHVKAADDDGLFFTYAEIEAGSPELLTSAVRQVAATLRD